MNKMKFILLLTSFYFHFHSGLAQVSENNQDLTSLKSLNARFMHNFVTNDTVSHSKIIHKDFVAISAKGRRTNRRDYLRGWARGFDPTVIVYWDYRNEKITIFGTMALVSAVNKFIIVKDGMESMAMALYTDTYIKEKSEWKCVQAQTTPVAEENYPPESTVVKKYIRGVLQ